MDSELEPAVSGPPYEDPAAAKLNADAAKALMCSVAGVFCCGFSAVIGIIWGTQTLHTARLLNLPQEAQRSWAAIGLGLFVILVYLLVLVLKLIELRNISW